MNSSNLHRIDQNRPFAFSTGFWLGVVLIACKGVLLGLPSSWSIANVMDHTTNLGIMAHSDVLFAAAFGLAGCFALRRCINRPLLRTFTVTVMLGVALVSLVYGIVSV